MGYQTMIRNRREGYVNVVCVAHISDEEPCDVRCSIFGPHAEDTESVFLSLIGRSISPTDWCGRDYASCGAVLGVESEAYHKACRWPHHD
jgi:hypothetical protein